ncbi:MAG TPA: carboxypeptidase-like regulatory domain-containing protein, partial [Verrucomicrobiae bacterium]
GGVAPARAALMSGSVQDELGETITEVRLEFGNDAGIWFLADLRDGKYEVNLVPGTWRVKPWSYWAGREVDYFDQEYLIPVGDSAVVTNLVFPKLRSRIEGTIRTISGEPLQLNITMNATLNGQSIRAYGYPDTNGVFGVRLPNATWSVQPPPSLVDQAGYIPVAEQTITLVNETNTTAQFVLSPVTNIVRGRVVDDAGAPIANVPMFWSSYGGFWRNVTTDADGNYSFAAQADRWTFYFYGLQERRLAPTFFSTRMVEVAEGAEVTTCNARLFRMPYDIHVRFVDENGNLSTSAPPSIVVQSRLDGEPVQLSAQIANGTADLAVAAGSWTVLGPSPFNETVNITSESVEVTFVVHPTNSQSRFFGKVVDEQGAGIPNFQIRGTWNGPIDMTDADGNFEFLLPTESLYPRAVDTNYLMAGTSVAPSPDHPAERVITVRRATSAIVVKLNFPEGSHPSSMSAWSSTRVGGSVYSVDDLNGTNSVIRLRAFPGTWKVNASGSGFWSVEPRIVEVGMEDVEVAFDFQPATQVSSGTVRGKAILSSGSPLKYVNTQAEGGTRWDYGQTDEEGRFSLKLTGKGEITIFNWPLAIKIAADVKEGTETDLGTIQLPALNVKAVVTFVDETGAPIKFSGYYRNQIRLTRDTGAPKFEVVDEGFENQRSALLTPGLWKIESETRDEGFAVAAPVMLGVGEGEVRTNIVLRRLGATRTMPVISIVSGVEGLALRMSSATSKYMDIESSADLKVWKYYSTQPMIESQMNLAIPASSGSANLYFKAANADLPAE